jgi:predicted RNA-binding Zn-ribbon protein involved in translation (DUF1610 family)
MELKGKMETTYVWTCADCGTKNSRCDDKHCMSCGKEITAEKYLRHFKLTPEPMRLGFVV